MANSLDKLLKEAEEKCSQKEESVETLNKFIKKFLLIVSRVARLLECLEFDPLEFCHLLDAAEAQAKQIIKTDIPKYIISKLGLNRDPFEELLINNENNCLVNNVTDNSVSSSVSNSTPLLNQRQHAPCEEDFEQIKLISNGAYG